ncbi:MAG: UDP-N-acetylglucosamine--N-acetylmuramyl-(pentapeptide) pyrophosphoryl-undecaprenol N-acetylglucosamine transferase [Aquificae bacterium]|nr:UDP-N-acetylglucosamine--N-acetylmuramyl-(pentapeptide) pyrophosphoryl-undecaprenol N-acetylglucosamine transferase [Aquificota bacterium]
MRTLALAGGGTGGHFFPLIAVAGEAKESKTFERLYFFGDRGGVEFKNRDLLEEIFDRSFFFRLRKFRGASALQKAAFLASTAAVSLRILKPLRGRFVSLVFGGYASVPLALATRLRRRPLFLHEQNAVPGGANAALSKFARRVFVAFPEAADYFRRAEVVGMPLRRELKRYKNLSREEVLKDLGWEPKPTVLVLGGSQGARTLNGLALFLARRLEGVRVVLVSGPRHYETLKEEVEPSDLKAELRLFPFCREVGKLLRVADFAVSRAGASTAFELAYFGVPTLFVPYPYAARDHQAANARYFAREGGALLVREEELRPEAVAALLKDLLSDPRTLNRMSEAMERLFIPDAERKILKVLSEEV